MLTARMRVLFQDYKMRIALISREYPPDSGWGGIATYTYSQAQSLKKLGHEVEVFSLHASTGAKLGKAASEEGITVHRVPTGGLDALSIIHSAMPYSHYVMDCVMALSRKFFAVHCERPFDVVEAPEHLGEGCGIALTRAVPLVVRLHTPLSKLVAEGFHNLTMSFDQHLVALLERLAMVSCDLITSPSEDMADYIAQDLNYRRDRIVILRNPVDTTKFCPDGQPALDDNSLTVLFVGRLEERKGIHYLIEAIPTITSACSGVRFVILGSDTNTAHGQAAVLPMLQESLRQSRQSDFVKFIPHVALADMPAYYRSADVCVFPSLYDNAPCTCLEAMAVGKPIVTTSAGGSSEYVLDRFCGLIVKPRDASGLANAIIELLRNPEMRISMGNNGRHRAVNSYDCMRIAEESIGVYRRAIEHHQEKSDAALYQKQPELLSVDALHFLQSFDKLIYDFFYTRSFDFRIKHRLKRIQDLVKH
jgi:glycosyltransferase involved in cell wall biosynthesis